MKKLTALLMTISLALLATGCAGKVAVINTQEIYQNSEAGKAGVAYLTKISEELQSKLADAEDNTKKSANRNTAMLKFREQVAAAQQTLNLEQQKVMFQVNKKLQDALASYRQKKHIDIIVDQDNAAAYSDKADITNQIIEEMNRTPLSFDSQATAPAIPIAE